MIRQALREIGRAPVRIITSVLALALAVGAIGVLAIPTVSTSSLRDAASRDGIPQVILPTTDTGPLAIADLAAIDNVDRAEPQVRTSTVLDGDRYVDVLGIDAGNQELDIVRVIQGRLPSDFGDVVVNEDVAPLGALFETELADGTPIDLRVVGIGGTTFWNDSDIVFTTLDTAAGIAGIEGANRIVIRTNDQDKSALRSTANAVRTELNGGGITTTSLPFTIPGGRHPIEADIDQVSRLVGLLGIVAGLVALVLLASTTNTLITERTREVAVMRALGAPNRQMRRRLRRLALGIAAAATVIGVPLGIAISNVIARLLLDEFVGLTPGFAVSIPVMVGSAAFALIGARVVAARAAWRVTNRPLAEALRDRDGSPFGRRISERIAAAMPLGGLLDRTAIRNGVHHRSRALAMLAQIAAAVAALLVIGSLATTVNSYNAAVDAPTRWVTRTFVPGPGLDIEQAVADTDPALEVGADISGELAGWEIDIYGYEPDTQMVDRTMRSGQWFEAPGEVAISEGFAQRIGVDIGDQIEVDMASGSHTYTVAGLHPDRDRAVFIDIGELAEDMNRPGMGNVLLSATGEPTNVLAGPLEIQRFDPGSDDNGTNAILMVFTAIGGVIVAVAGLAVASGLAVNVYERRGEFAALRALGGRKRHVFRVVVAELLPLGVAGVAIGIVAGYIGAAAIIESFEASNAVDIGFTFATGAVPAAAAAVVIGSAFLGWLMVRRVSRQPAAVALRGAA